MLRGLLAPTCSQPFASLVQIAPPATTSAQTASWPSRRLFSFARPSDRGSALVSGRGQRSHGQLPVEVLGDLRLGLGRLVREHLVEALELAPQPRRVHPGWHRRHLLAARELQAKPLEGALDPLKPAPDRGRLPTLGQEADEVGA
jgi:hypothetical protein